MQIIVDRHSYQCTCTLLSQRSDKSKQQGSPWGGATVPGGLASDPEHGVLAHMFPTPPTNEKYHQLSPAVSTDFGSGDYTLHDASFGSANSMSLLKEPAITISVSIYTRSIRKLLTYNCCVGLTVKKHTFQ